MACTSCADRAGRAHDALTALLPPFVALRRGVGAYRFSAMRPRLPTLLLSLYLLFLPHPGQGQALEQLSTDELEARVSALLERSCTTAGCHVGPTPQMGMDLTPDRFFGSTVGVPSQERPDLLRVHPGQPDSSYVVMKLEGEEGIIGTQMPFTGDKLTPQEIATIKAWIGRLSKDDLSERAEPPPEVYPFTGWKVVNLPTNRTVERGSLLFLIGHRFNPEVGDGYDAFFGLDGSSIIFLNLGYALTDRLFVNLGRSNADDDVELNLKARFARQQPGGWPISVGAQGSLNWFSGAPSTGSRFRSEALKLSTQLILTRAFGPRAGVAVVPGVLLNPASAEDGEGPLFTVGLGGRVNVHGSLALVGEWVPIVGGYARTATFGNDNRFDSWAGGLEIATPGHVFQIVVSNSVGLATDQYLRGGDLDIRDSELRLGFNIFRVLPL